MRRTALVLASIAVLAAGCGSSAKKTSPSPGLHILPDVKTSDEWARRIVSRFLTPLNQDLQVLNGLNNPDIRIFIASGNKQTIGITTRRMNDLERCTDKLVEIGPPTTDDKEFQHVAGLFKQSCAPYEQVARKVLEALPKLSSGRTDVINEGEKTLRNSIPESEAAAKSFKRAIAIAERRPEFRNAGLQSG